MKKITLFILSVLCLNTYSQQLFFNDFDNNDDFSVKLSGHSFIVSQSTGIQNMNTWYNNDVYAGGTITAGGSSFTIEDTPSQTGTGISSPNGKYRHLVGISGKSQSILNANMQQDAGISTIPFQSDFIEMDDTISTLGMNNVSFNFYWLGDGGRGFVYYSFDDGDNWTIYKGDGGDTTFYVEYTDWALETIKLDVFNDKPSLKFGFLFDNSASALDNEPAFSIDDIFIANAPIEIIEGNKLKTDGSANSIKWINCTTNTHVGSGDAIYNPPSTGEYKAQLTYDGGIVTTDCIQFVISTLENIDLLNATIYPNPVKSNAFIKLDKTIKNLDYSITNILGVSMMSNSLNNTSEFNIDTEGFVSGIYFLNIKINNETKIFKFTVTK